MAMALSSSVPAQGPALRDEENGIVKEQDSLHLGSAPQQTPLQRFHTEVYTPVEADLALYDARERELEVTYGEGLQDRAMQQGLLPACLDEDYNEFCYKEIENLVLIERSLIHRKALEEWDRKATLLTSRVDRKSKKVGNLKNEVYQLIGFFSVFQGVVLTAVAQSNLLHCNNLWSPIVLSALASVVTIFAVAQKLLHIWSFQKTISAEQSSLQEAVRRGQLLRRFGKAFVFRQLGKANGPKKEHSHWYTRWYTAPYTVAVLISLFSFALGFPLSHWRILCHSGHC